MSRSLGSTELKRLHREWRRLGLAKVSLLLDSVATPANVGSILRTAAAMRVEEIWVCGQTPDTDSGGVNRTALGSQRFVTIHRCEQPAQAVVEAHAAGYQVLALELADDATALHDLDLTGPVCLAVGHEDRGLSATTLAAADLTGFIPQLGRIGSLNAATAASIALYECRRQGWPAGA